MKTAGNKTPQPSPAPHSAVQKALGQEQEFAGTPDRLSSLRGTCLIRDRHRCVISRKFDFKEAAKRIQKSGDDARDDDGVLLKNDPQAFETLEVAHVLPHSLMKVEDGSELVCFSPTRLIFHQLTDLDST